MSSDNKKYAIDGKTLTPKEAMNGLIIALCTWDALLMMPFVTMLKSAWSNLGYLGISTLLLYSTYVFVRESRTIQKVKVKSSSKS